MRPSILRSLSSLTFTRRRLLLLLSVSLVHSGAGLYLMHLAGSLRYRFPLVLFGVLFFSVLFSFLEELLIIPIGAQVGKKLAHESFLGLLALPRKEISLKLQREVEEEANWFSEWLVSTLRALFKRIIQIVLFFAWLLYLDYRLAAATVPFMILFVVPGLLLGRKAGHIRRALFAAQGELARFHSEAVLNVDTLKGHHATRFACDQDRALLDSLWQYEQKHRFLHALLSPLSFLILLSGALTLWLYGTSLISQGTLSSGTLLSFFTGLALLYQPLSGIGRDLVLARSVRETPHLSRLLIVPSPEPPLRTTSRAVSLHNICFGYDTPLLTDFSYTFKRGTATLVRGPNGSGKSTLVQLILGIVTPQSGELLFDGETGLPERIGYLDQQGALFTGTSEMNILLGRRLTCAPLFMHREGILSTRTLSGGERQRVAVDRALAGAPSLIILDEPEESLDVTSLSLLKTQLQKLKEEGSIIIIVSHSDRFAELCDDTIIME